MTWNFRGSGPAPSLIEFTQTWAPVSPARCTCNAVTVLNLMQGWSWGGFKHGMQGKAIFPSSFWRVNYLHHSFIHNSNSATDVCTGGIAYLLLTKLVLSSRKCNCWVWLTLPVFWQVSTTNRRYRTGYKWETACPRGGKTLEDLQHQPQKFV